MKNFLVWAKLTNTTKVFQAFPGRNQPERISIFPVGMDALYQAKKDNILQRAKYYTDRVGGTYGEQTKVPSAEAKAEYQKLEEALTSHRHRHPERG